MAGKNDGIEVNFGILPNLIGYQVRMTQIAIFRDFSAALAEHEITPTQFGTLVIIDANPGVKQSELAAAIQLDRSSVVSLIDRMEREGYVKRTRVESDRRANALSLTREGVKLLSVIKPLVKRHEQRLLKRLSANERSQLTLLLGRLLAE